MCGTSREIGVNMIILKCTYNYDTRAVFINMPEAGRYLKSLIMDFSHEHLVTINWEAIYVGMARKHTRNDKEQGSWNVARSHPYTGLKGVKKITQNQSKHSVH